MSTNRTNIAALSAALAIMSVTPAAPGQQVFYVDDDAPPGQNGSSWQNAIWDLQVALAKANAWPSRGTQGVVIKVAQGVYWPDPTGQYPEISFRVVSGVTLVGGFRGLSGAGDPSERDPERFVTTLRNQPAVDAVPAGETYCIVRVLARSPSATLDGFTVTGAHSEGGVNVRGQGRILNCRIVGNLSGYYAAGIDATGDWLEVRNCAIEDNTGNSWTYGGGVYAGVGAVRVASCRIVNNTASYGAAIAIWAGSAVIESCEITGNSTDQTPSSGSYRSVIALTKADYGDFTPPFPGNTSAVRINNCTIAGNLGNIASGDRAVEFRNCILRVDSQPQSFFTGEGTFVDCALSALPDLTNFTLVRSPVRSANFVSPLDFRLSANSPCIDAGRNEWLIDGSGDAAGAPRIAGARVDIGAYEYGSFVCAGDFNNSGNVSPQDIYEYLATWTLSLPAADFNLDSRVSAQDIYDFLAAWYHGCD